MKTSIFRAAEPRLPSSSCVNLSNKPNEEISSGNRSNHSAGYKKLDQWRSLTRAERGPVSRQVLYENQESMDRIKPVSSVPSIPPEVFKNEAKPEPTGPVPEGEMESLYPSFSAKPEPTGSVPEEEMDSLSPSSSAKPEPTGPVPEETSYASSSEKEAKSVAGLKQIRLWTEEALAALEKIPKRDESSNKNNQELPINLPSDTNNKTGGDGNLGGFSDDKFSS